jgi:hypothetical protein
MSADTALTITPHPCAPASAADLAERAGGYARQARANNTRRAYRAAWADFCAWCTAQGHVPLLASPATLGLFLADRAGTHRVASLRLRLVALRQAHSLAGNPVFHTADTVKVSERGAGLSLGHSCPCCRSAARMPANRANSSGNHLGEGAAACDGLSRGCGCPGLILSRHDPLAGRARRRHPWRRTRPSSGRLPRAITRA